MSYPYVDGNNLDAPQSYMYTKYEQDTFWKAFNNSRSKILNLKTDSEPEVKPITNQQEVEQDGVYLTHAIMSLCMLGEKNVKDQFLSKLLQRFEVSKRFYDTYRLSFRSKIGEYRQVELYLLGQRLFLNEYLENSDLRYLNCALKVGDTLVGLERDGKVETRYLTFLQNSFLREEEIVKKLRGCNGDS